jgi:hypothetical protein
MALFHNIVNTFFIVYCVVFCRLAHNSNPTGAHACGIANALFLPLVAAFVGICE